VAVVAAAIAAQMIVADVAAMQAVAADVVVHQAVVSERWMKINNAGYQVKADVHRMVVVVE
jgi:hypothetical protein